MFTDAPSCIVVVPTVCGSYEILLTNPSTSPADVTIVKIPQVFTCGGEGAAYYGWPTWAHTGARVRSNMKTICVLGTHSFCKCCFCYNLFSKLFALNSVKDRTRQGMSMINRSGKYKTYRLTVAVAKLDEISNTETRIPEIKQTKAIMQTNLNFIQIDYFSNNRNYQVIFRFLTMVTLPLGGAREPTTDTSVTTLN